VTRRVAAVALGLALIIPAPSTAPVVASAAPGGGPPQVATPSSVGPAPVAGPPVAAAPPVVPPQARTTLVSRTGTGAFPDNRSVTPSISVDGRYVAYSSLATDIRPQKAGAAIPAIFVFDTVARTTIRLPNPPGLRPGGTAMDPSISGKGEVVAFTYVEPFDDSGAYKGPWVVAWTRATNRTTIVSRTPQGAPVAGATEPSVSANARFVAYTARNADIVPRGGNDANVVRYDLRSHRTVVVSIGQRGSVSPRDETSPSISRDGDAVAFVSDGGDVLVPWNTGPGTQVFVRHILAGQTEQVSLQDGRGPGDGAPDQPAFAPSISADGTRVAFESPADTLVAGGKNGVDDVFVRDLTTVRTTMVSVTPDGRPAPKASGAPSISADGRMVAFESQSPDVIGLGADVDAHLAAVAIVQPSEVYERDTTTEETVLVSADRNGRPGGAVSAQPSVGGNGRFVAFASTSPNLVRGDSGPIADVFLRDMPPVPTLTPAAHDFGTLPLQTTSPPLAATLVNQGWGPLLVQPASFTGSGHSDYRVVFDGCQGVTLHRTEPCTVSITFRPTGSGSRPATLVVPNANRIASSTSRLSGAGQRKVVTPQGSVTLDPPIGPPGIVTTVTGTGFAPGSKVRLTWSVGETPTLPIVQVDATGRFRKQVLVFHNDLTGPRDLVATPLGGGKPASATMLVIRPSVVPPGFLIIRRLIDLPLVLVIRG
jgi:Tol biopolymer transport system component